MKSINNKIIAIIILSILVLVNVIDGYKIEDITPNKINRQFTDSVCSFSKYIQCVVTIDGESCDTLTIQGTIYYDVVSSNSTASIVSLATYDITPNNYTYQINGYTLNLECILIDINSISIKTIGYFRTPMPSYMSYAFYGLFRIEGIDTSKPFTINSIQSQLQDFQDCYTGNPFANYLSITCFYQFRTTYNLSSPIPILISNTKIFNLDPILKEPNLNSMALTIKISPANTGSPDLICPGYGLGPLIEFTINNTYLDSWYLLSKSASSNFQMNYFYPISGNDYSSTFLYNIPTDTTDYSTLLYQLNNGVFIYVGGVQGVITQYGIVSPQYDSNTITANINAYQDSLPIINVNFHSFIPYSSTGFGITTNSDSENYRAMNFPFGFVSGRNNEYTFSVSIPVMQYEPNGPNFDFSITFIADRTGPTLSYSNLGSGGISNPPVVKSIETYHLVSDLYLYRIKAQIPNSLLYFSYTDGGNYGYETLVENLSNNHAIYEIIFSKDLDLSVYDLFGNIGFISNEYPLTEPLGIFNAPFAKVFDIVSIQNVSYLYSEIDVTNQRQYNKLYFNYTDESLSRDTPFILAPLGFVYQDILNPKDPLFDNRFYSIYNQKLKLFEIEFYVDSNTPSGKFQFELLYGQLGLHSDLLPTQLLVKSSNWDLRGSTVSYMNKSLPSAPIGVNHVSDLVSWIFTIEDKANGFDWGYITLRGDLDSSIYNFTFTSNDVLSGGNMYSGQYQFNISVAYPCVSQKLIITESALFDQMGRKSYFSIYSPILIQNTPVMNPFSELLANEAFNIFPYTCDVFGTDDSPPELVSFFVSSQNIDVSKTNRQLTFSFTARDLESGIKLDQYPIVYLTAAKYGYLECKSKIISSTPIKTTTEFGNSVNYECSIDIPLGFAYPQDIFLSIYGFINNNGYYGGFTINDLKDLNLPFSIGTSFSTFEPNIQSYYRITEKGGDLWLMGRSLWSSSTTTSAFIKFSDNSTATVNPSTFYSSAILLKNIKATSKPYQVSITLSNGLQSNTITVIPTIFNIPNISSSTSSSSSSSSNTDIPLPTNKPQSCPGNPVCGGPSNGICVTNQGCVCLSGRVGLDCSSEIIIIDQPKINDTSPSTNITLPVSDGSSSTTVTYKSLITLVSIRELDVSGKPIFSKSFEKWQVTALQSDNTTLIYNTTLEINKNNQISTTSFKVTLNWFTKQSNITFANEQLIMNPSTMKYTIEIGNYPFDSTLNHLQLVMSASIESDSKDNSVCSVREFGETTSGDNSNYLKIQVDNHSLYGRFIRRGILDSTTRSITNVLLDKDMNSITTTKQLQSFIGIEIPHFNDNAIIDPDFSVLIDSKSASSKSNSICSKSKLSGAKIAGIVIGCVAFVAVITVAITYHIIKKKRDAKFISNVNQKIKQMNNDKL